VGRFMASFYDCVNENHAVRVLKDAPSTYIKFIQLRATTENDTSFPRKFSRNKLENYSRLHVLIFACIWYINTWCDAIDIAINYHRIVKLQIPFHDRGDSNPGTYVWNQLNDPIFFIILPAFCINGFCINISEKYQQSWSLQNGKAIIVTLKQ